MEDLRRTAFLSPVVNRGKHRDQANPDHMWTWWMAINFLNQRVFSATGHIVFYSDTIGNLEKKSL